MTYDPAYKRPRTIKGMSDPQLVHEVAVEADVTERTAKRCVRALAKIITQSVKDGQAVSIYQFGTFRPMTWKGKRVKPHFGGPRLIRIQESRYIRFKAFDSLRKRLNPKTRKITIMIP